MEKNNTNDVTRIGIYARISTSDQQTLPMQTEALKKYAKQRQWQVVMEIEETGSGTSTRPQRELLLKAARQRKIDNILVWRLDRWGRSLSDIFSTLEELNELKVGFISLTEALDLNTITGTAMAGLLAVFAKFERDLLKERVKAGIIHARKLGRPHGRPKTAALKQDEVKNLFQQGYSKAKIARQLKIGRSSVTRMLCGINVNRHIEKFPARPSSISSENITTTSGSKSVSIEKTITVLLSVYIENNSKFVRGKSKTKNSIDFYLTSEFDAEKIDDDEYKLIISYKDDNDLDDKIYDILSELQHIADGRYWGSGPIRAKTNGFNFN